MHTCARLALLLPFAALVACSPRQPPEPTAPGSSASATPSLPDAVPAASPDGASAASGRRNDPAVINFAGFGPATFGSDEEHVRMAWGYPLDGGERAPGSTCRYLDMSPQPADGHGIRFMMEEGRFVRYDVDVPLHVAPGDIVVGDEGAAVRKAFEGRVEDQPHKYVEGASNLIVSSPDGGAAKLVFETDAAGNITSWRIGVPPQVYYVEGCG